MTHRVAHHDYYEYLDHINAVAISSKLAQRAQAEECDRAVVAPKGAQQDESGSDQSKARQSIASHACRVAHGKCHQPQSQRPRRQEST